MLQLVQLLVIDIRSDRIGSDQIKKKNRINEHQLRIFFQNIAFGLIEPFTYAR